MIIPAANIWGASRPNLPKCYPDLTSSTLCSSREAPSDVSAEEATFQSGNACLVSFLCDLMRGISVADVTSGEWQSLSTVQHAAVAYNPQLEFLWVRRDFFPPSCNIVFFSVAPFFLFQSKEKKTWKEQPIAIYNAHKTTPWWHLCKFTSMQIDAVKHSYFALRFYPPPHKTRGHITGPVTPPRRVQDRQTDSSKTNKNTPLVAAAHVKAQRTDQSVWITHWLIDPVHTWVYSITWRNRVLLLCSDGGARCSHQDEPLFWQKMSGGEEKNKKRTPGKSQHTETGSRGNVIWMAPLSQQPHRLPLTCETTPSSQKRYRARASCLNFPK